MKIAQVDFGRCRACQVCPARKACRTKALIHMGPNEQAVVKSSDCMGCGDCIDACPYRAITVHEG